MSSLNSLSNILVLFFLHIQYRFSIYRKVFQNNPTLFSFFPFRFRSLADIINIVEVPAVELVSSSGKNWHADRCIASVWQSSVSSCWTNFIFFKKEEEGKTKWLLLPAALNIYTFIYSLRHTLHIACSCTISKNMVAIFVKQFKN